MGNQQPKKIAKVNKIQIEVATTKSKFHLELMRDRKNAEIIKAQKQLVNRIKSHSRNKLEEVLIAERIINALKYAQACNFLMSYCASLKPQANFIAENLYNPQKIQPFLGMIYTLIFAAQTMGLSSLKQFRDLLRALNDPTVVTTFVNPQIRDLLSPQPTPSELNQYFIQMSERNQIPLQEINIIGHKFSNNINQKPSNEPTFSELQKMIADELSKKINDKGPGGQGGQFGGQGEQFGGQGGQFGGQGGQINPYGPNGQGWSGNNGNPYDKVPPGMSNPYVNPYQTPNYGPNIQAPGTIEPSKNVPPPSSFNQGQSRMSIKDVNDIAFYPEIIKPEPAFKDDPDFNTLCEKIKTGL